MVCYHVTKYTYGTDRKALFYDHVNFHLYSHKNEHLLDELNGYDLINIDAKSSLTK